MGERAEAEVRRHGEEEWVRALERVLGELQQGALVNMLRPFAAVPTPLRSTKRYQKRLLATSTVIRDARSRASTTRKSQAVEMMKGGARVHLTTIINK